jgi:hypothetical protein
MDHRQVALLEKPTQQPGAGCKLPGQQIAQLDGLGLRTERVGDRLPLVLSVALVFVVAGDHFKRIWGF